MARILIGFLLVWVSISLGISTWRELTKREKWETSKLVAFGFVTALLSCMLIAVFVILF